MNNKKILTQKYLKQLIFLVVTATVIGLLADKISMSDDYDPGRSDFDIGFFIIVPATIILLLLFFKTFNIKNKTFIVTITTVTFFLVMIFGYWFFEFRRGFVSDMYILVYILGTLPSIIVGLLFGFYIAKYINKP